MLKFPSLRLRVTLAAADKISPTVLQRSGPTDLLKETLTRPADSSTAEREVRSVEFKPKTISFKHTGASFVGEWDEMTLNQKQFYATEKEQPRTIQFWAAKIRRSDFQDLNAFIKDSIDKSKFWLQHPSLVEAAFDGRPDNFDSILAFAKQLPWEHGKALVLRDIIATLNKIGEGFSVRMMEVALTIKECEDAGVPQTLDSNYILTDARETLIHPKIAQLFSNSTCYFFNIKYGEYLYTAGDYYKLGPFRQVFTWIAGDRVVESSWKIEHIAKSINDDSMLIRLEDKYYSGYYLGQSGHDGLYDYERRFVYTALPGDDFNREWLLSTHNIDGRVVFTLRSSFYWEYLYAANDYHNYNYQRRRVFTWVPGDLVTQGFWDAICE